MKDNKWDGRASPPLYATSVAPARNAEGRLCVWDCALPVSPAAGGSAGESDRPDDWFELNGINIPGV